MKSIKYMKFDEQGNYVAQIESSPKYTVRDAMEHLQGNGFFPMFENERKLKKVWTNGKGINAYIL